LVIYVLVLGVPLLGALGWEQQLEQLVGRKWWVWLWIVGAVLTTAAHYVNLYFQRRTEAWLLREQRQYQTALRTMSQELIGFADVKSVCNFVGQYVGEQMGLTSAELIVQGNGLGAPHAVGNNIPAGVKELLQRWIASPTRTDTYILAEELGAGRPDTEIRTMRTWMARMGIASIVPGWMRGELVSCLVLGHKRTGAMFSPEDFEVLEALARQSALVIKSLELFEEVAAQKRLAEFGELMNAINHEFNNIFVIISGTLQLLVENPNDPALRQQMAGLQEEILRGQYIIRSASAYRKKHRSPMESWALATVIETALTQAQQDAFAGAKPQLAITTAMPQDLELTGHATIPELVINALRCLGWACDSKPGTLHIEVSPEAPMVRLRFAMTGGEDLAPIIKKEGELAPEPGRHGGLYLFLVRLIVADHQGTLAIESTDGGGTTLLVRLPQEPTALAQAPGLHGAAAT
jgi:K+-sensing histidine kinase KdpD